MPLVCVRQLAAPPDTQQPHSWQWRDLWPLLPALPAAAAASVERPAPAEALLDVAAEPVEATHSTCISLSNVICECHAAGLRHCLTRSCSAAALFVRSSSAPR